MREYFLSTTRIWKEMNKIAFAKTQQPARTRFKKERRRALSSLGLGTINSMLRPAFFGQRRNDNHLATTVIFLGVCHLRIL